MSARNIPAGAIALPCVVSSAESQSFKAQSSQRVSLTPCRLPGVDGEARCGSYEVYEDRRARKGRKITLKIAVLPAPFLFIRNDKGQVAQMFTIQDGRVTAAKKIK